MPVSKLLERISQLQLGDVAGPAAGNYPSTRYHRALPISRVEDNVYFVSWIHQLLNRYKDLLTADDQTLLDCMNTKANQSIARYRNRYGDISYNFYRPKAWFPNGRMLSRFTVFQPTDDADDSSIAYRGMLHSPEEAKALKAHYVDQANGAHGKWIKRIPKNYRGIEAYNTWIGSPSLYVDIDLVVLSNVLIFNTRYDLPHVKQDSASINFILQTVTSGEYLSKRWSLAAWYPFPAVILYSLADLSSLNYYPSLLAIVPRLLKDARELQVENADPCTLMLLDSVLMKLGAEPQFVKEDIQLEEYLNNSQSFSFGVIPLTHPWNGITMQWLGSISIFRMYYDCEAQRLAIYLEWLLLKDKCKGRAEHHKPDSVHPQVEPNHLSKRPTH